MKRIDFSALSLYVGYVHYYRDKYVFVCLFQPSHLESYVPFMPNVLKVFLENGQTKSFKYDNKTTVKVR